VSTFATRWYPQLLAGALCAGIAAPNLFRAPGAVVLVFACGAAVASAVLVGSDRLVALAFALVVAGWWWGSARLDVLDRSRLEAKIGRAGRAEVITAGPPRPGRFDVRVEAVAVRFDELHVHEPVLLRLPRGRAPPQGALLDGIAEVAEPRGPSNGFDEARWLRRRGIHVVLRMSHFHVIGRRGGIGGVADALRRRLKRSVAYGLSGERAAVLEGVVLGEESRLSEELRARFRAAGLYHLLAVSGQNVAYVAGGALVLAWLLGLPRMLGQIAALASIIAYVLAVGPQPSVLRAGVAGALGCVAWLTARTADRWHLLLMGAVALLAWNPYTLLDPGFQLSFAAVLAIFVLVPRFTAFLEGYPLGRPLRMVTAVSAACGLATAPIAWAHFHSLQLLTIPANALAAPVVAPLLGLALAGVAVAPFSGGAAATLAWLNGWCAAYLVAVARIVGGLPFAQITSTRSLLVLLGLALLVAAYASGGRGKRIEARVPPHRQRPAEDSARAQAAPRPHR
jgi:competence protein ComEC